MPAPVGRPSKYDPGFCALVEDAMGEGYSLTAFAGIVGVDRSTINVWIHDHSDFLEAVSRAKAKRMLHWEKAGLNAAARGGGPGASTMIIFGLKNMDRGSNDAEWADVNTQKLVGDPSNPVVQVIERRIVDPSNTNG